MLSIDKSSMNNEMKIAHFSHEHPLVLFQTTEVDSDVETTSRLCYGCRQIISEAMYYRCGTHKCYFILHKDCANLPLEIKHPIHAEHPLILLATPHYSYCCCFCCGKFLQDIFTFSCSSCKFDLCVECAHLVLQKRRLEHNSHQHPLTLMQKPATFCCDACDQRKKDLSFSCNSCPYWIHKSCAFLPSTANSVGHGHPLSLTYHLPYDLLHYQFKCDVCGERFNPSRWLYHCYRCRHFVHVNCLHNRSTTAGGLLDTFFDRFRKGTPLDHELHLKPAPWTDVSADVIRPFLEKKCNLEIQLIEEISHFSHPHQLILSSEQIGKGRYEEETLCDACTEPITVPYYSCVECHFFLHLSCANLPAEVKHHSHQDHQLSLKNLEVCGSFYCNLCHMHCNGFFFECEPCKFRIHLLCAILPPLIKHQSHYQHLLKQNEEFTRFDQLCNACGKDMCGLVKFSCTDCSHFYLHYQCAIMPIVVNHRWEKHCLSLMYPPFHDHPDEIYCEICEEELHPKYWMYHCKECDQSFHLSCIPRLGEDRFMKFGKTLQVSSHQHLLTSVRESRYKSSCTKCQIEWTGKKGFECRPCKYFLCYECACGSPNNPSSSGCAIL